MRGRHPFVYIILAGLALSSAHAEAPQDWQLGFQSAASPLMENIVSFHHFVLIIITAICLLVLALLICCVVLFNARANPHPSQTSHNPPLEVFWTLTPALILVIIAIPSLRILKQQTTIPEAHMTIKVTGQQWYWSYEYPDFGELAFDAILREDDANHPRLLSADEPLVIPENTVVRVQITSADVLHSWALPAMGVKMDAVPGRLNETWFKATRRGVYYGQCSELCGARHAFMPIELHVVSKTQFQHWISQTQTRLGFQPQETIQR